MSGKARGRAATQKPSYRNRPQDLEPIEDSRSTINGAASRSSLNGAAGIVVPDRLTATSGVPPPPSGQPPPRVNVHNNDEREKSTTNTGSALRILRAGRSARSRGLSTAARTVTKMKRNSIENSVQSASGIMSLFRPETIAPDGAMMTSNDKHMKYIFVTGSMLSNSGKNTTTASIGKKLQDLGHTVTVIKVDNYLNLDFGLLSPIKFGEIFVFNDGTECHYDCGIYERYLNIELTWKHHITLGKILNYININERNGKFYGNVITMKNEQVIDIICQWIYNVAHVPIRKLHVDSDEKNEAVTPQVCIVDFGGFVEDQQSDLFLQAMKHFQRYYVDNRDQSYLHLHFSYIIEHAIDSADNRNQKLQVIHQFSETAERCVRQELIPRRIIPDILVLRFEGRARYISGDRYKDNSPHVQDSILRKFYNLLTFGHASHRFITNKMQEAGMETGDALELSMDDIRSKIIELPNLDTTYAIPSYLLQNTYIFDTIAEKFGWPEIERTDETLFDIIGTMGIASPRATKAAINASVFEQLAMKVRTINREVNIGLVGKYGTDDLTYLSLIEALKLSALSQNVQLNITVIASDELETQAEKREYGEYVPQQTDNSKKDYDPEDMTDFEKNKFTFMKHGFEKPDFKDDEDDAQSIKTDANSNALLFDEQTYHEAWRDVGNMDGILVGGGFGVSGILGIISVIKHCREKNVPFFGICFGMQLAVIEYARNVLNLKDSNSIEINSACKNQLVIQMPTHLKEMNKFGHTMRLGSCTVKLNKDSLAYKLYGNNDVIYERHRHGYEVNPLFFEKLEDKGLIISGKDKASKTCEIIELDTEFIWKNHSYFIAAQFHPELVASAYKPSPLFTGLVSACKERKYGSGNMKKNKLSRVNSSRRN